MHATGPIAIASIQAASTANSIHRGESSVKRASPTHSGRWLAQTNYDALMTHHTTENWWNGIFKWVKSCRCGCLVTWFCYQLIAKPGNKTAALSWPDPYCNEPLDLSTAQADGSTLYMVPQYPKAKPNHAHICYTIWVILAWSSMACESSPHPHNCTTQFHSEPALILRQQRHLASSVSVQWQRAGHPLYILPTSRQY